MKKEPINPGKKNTINLPKPAHAQETDRDADDMVHSQKLKDTTELGEADPDDVLHRSYRPGTGSAKENNLQDPDDRSHEYLEEKE